MNQLLHTIFILFFTALSIGATQPNAAMIKEVVEQWESNTKSSGQNISDSEIPKLLATVIIKKIPDAQMRMKALMDYAAFGGGGSPITAWMVWKKMASDEVRAAFLNNALQTATNETIGYISTFTADDLVDAETVLANPGLEGATALEREIVYSGKSFIPLLQSSEGVSSRLLAIWFSKAPYLAASASLHSSDEQTIEQLRRVNSLRHEIDKAQSGDQKEQAWRKLDQELQSLLLSGSPVLEMYAAGVLKWRRTTVRSLNESESLVGAIKKCSNPAVSCILQGITIETLTSLPSDKITLVSTPNPIVAPTAITAQPTPPLPMATPPPQEQVASSSPTLEETKPAPWPWITGAILLLAVATGVLLKLRRK